MLDYPKTIMYEYFIDSLHFRRVILQLGVKKMASLLHIHLMLGREELTQGMIQVREIRRQNGMKEGQWQKRRKKRMDRKKRHTETEKLKERKIDGRDEREGEELIFKNHH